jgi:hypothetical protein
VATLEVDQVKRDSIRASVAAHCREKYGMAISVEDVTDCDGCGTMEGRLFSGCAQCKIRSCVQDRRLESCAFCQDFGCGLLRAQWKLDPEAEIRLKQLRSEIKTGMIGASWSPGTGD